jgi:PAS domain S-box-containing protein
MEKRKMEKQSACVGWRLLIKTMFFNKINLSLTCFVLLSGIACASQNMPVHILYHDIESIVFQTNSNETPALIWFLKIFVIITLFIMGLYNMVIYMMRKKDKAPFFFGLFSIILAINTLISASGYWFVQEIFGYWPQQFQMRYKLDICTIMLCIPVFIQFIHCIYPAENKKKIAGIFWIITGLFILPVTLLQGRQLDFTFMAFYPVILAAIIYCLIITVIALKNRLPDSRGIMAGIIIMSLAGVNDVLWGMGLHTRILIPEATLFFVAIYSLIISRRFARAFAGAERLSTELIENQRLRDEMQVRIKQEQALRQVQRRLTELLQAIDEALCAIDDTGEVVFCNRAFEELTGYKSAQLSGKPLEQFLVIDNKKPTNLTEFAINDNDNNAELYGYTTITDSKGNSVLRNVSKIHLELEDEEISVLAFRIPGIVRSGTISPAAFIEALNRNRIRIQSLEKMMKNATSDLVQKDSKLGYELKMIDKNLEQINSLLNKDENSENKKQLGVKTIDLAVQYWIECTGKTKVDLAYESNLWKVQKNKDGWERTQTLDRYMDIKTFPKIPRWNQITGTADFVLLRCSSLSLLREELESLLQQLYIL